MSTQVQDLAALRWLSAPRLPWIAAVAACLLCAPSMWFGLFADDFTHRAFVLDHLHGHTSPVAWWDMFNAWGRTDANDVSRRIALGMLPWWTSPLSKAAFLRPLGSASHFIDYGLWPNAAWAMHLHNIVLYALIVLCAGALYRRLFGAGWTAGLALLLYAVDEAHADAVAWIASRNTLLTALFALLTLLLYDRARRDRSRIAGVCALPCLLLALASSEGATAIFAYLFAYALCLDRGHVRDRVLALLPLLLLALAWMTLCAALGYGMHHSGGYVDPRADPLLFLRFVGERLPGILRAQFGLPLELVRLLPPARQNAIGLVSFAFLALAAVVAAPLLFRSRTARFFALGTLGSAVPACAGGVEPRLLLIIGFGAHALVAELLAACITAWPSTPDGLRALRAPVAATLLLVHGPLAALSAPIMPFEMTAYDTGVRQRAASLPTGSELEHSTIMLLNGDFYLMSVFVDMYRRTFYTPGPESLYVLGTSSTAVQVRRPERNALVLETDAGYLQDPSSWFVRAPNEPFVIGQVVEVVGMRVTVEAIMLDGRPLRVRFDFTDAEDPRLLWVVWNAVRMRYERVVLPVVGGSLRFPASGATLPLQ